MPADSRVEIDAKITAGVWFPTSLLLAEPLNDYSLGYFTTGHRMTTEELEAVRGRTWEEWVFTLTELTRNANLHIVSTTRE